MQQKFLCSGKPAKKCVQESKKLQEYSKLQPHAKHKHCKNANNIFSFVFSPRDALVLVPS